MFASIHYVAGGFNWKAVVYNAAVIFGIVSYAAAFIMLGIHLRKPKI